MSFTTPIALIVLLIAVPIVVYFGWPRMAFRRSRDIVSLLLRLVIITLLALALAGTQVVQSADRLAVVFLVDVSDSIGTVAQEAQLEYIRESMTRMGPDDEAGVVLFGADAMVDRPINAVRELGPIRSAPITGNTDIAEAIRLGLALFPADVAQRMVILSDGRPTVGDTEAAAQLAAAAGVEIDYVTFSREPAPEVQITDVQTPNSVNAGQEFDLSISVEAEADTPASIVVLASGSIIHTEEVTLRAGANNYTLPLVAGDAGFTDFRVQVEPATDDAFYQNNQLSTFSQVIGPPRVLLVASTPEESEYLLPALEQSGITVDLAAPGDLPIGLAPLAQYSSVVLANVSATDLSNRRMEALQGYVRDLGGGLVVVGGPDSFAPGGYFQTPLEEALPVEMRIRDQQRLPQVTIVYVIDRSGSMSAVGPSGVDNLELAKEAIIRSIDFLQPTDRAGVVSFDSSGYWIANIQPIMDRFGLQRLVASLRTGGGTDILAGMTLAAREIVNEPSERKHIILLTDGGADPNGLVKLTEDLYNDFDVTTSVIAIGAGAATFLDDMATAGGGYYHPVDVVENIPTIFTVETVLATRSYIIEESFVPSLTANSPIMEGITSAPTLLGYVASSPRQTAQVILRGPGPYNDPLLASWQYGLGRSVAFTSDATARWGANWVSWGDFSRFWSQAVRWTITEGTSENLEPRIVMEGERARLVVDARDGDGGFLNGLTLQASMVDPSLNAERITLQQTAPGRYEALFAPDIEGAYFVRLTGNGVIGGETLEVGQTTGWVMSYSPEYDIRNAGPDEDLLADIAALTGGRSLADDPAATFAHTLGAQPAATNVWPWLLLVAVALLPFDIAVRRLVVTRRDLQRAREAVFGKAADVAQVPSERLSTLMAAKGRAQERTAEQAVDTPASTVGALRARRDEARTSRDAPAASAPTASGERPRFTPEGGQMPAPPAPSSTAGALLSSKRKRGKEE